MWWEAGSYLSSLTPITIVMSSSLAGAEMMTFFAPPSRCALAVGPVVNRPVDSMTMSTPRSPHGSLAGSRSARILIDLSPTWMVSPSTDTGCGSLPTTLSYCSKWAMVATSPRSLAATTSMPRSAAALPGAFTARQKLRPMRPNPLIPTRTVMTPVSVPGPRRGQGPTSAFILEGGQLPTRLSDTGSLAAEPGHPLPEWSSPLNGLVHPNRPGRQRGVVEDRLPSDLRRPDKGRLLQGGGHQRDVRASPPRAAVRERGPQPDRVGLQQVAVQATQQDPVGVDHVDQVSEPEPEALDQGRRRGPHRGVARVIAAQHGDRLRQFRDPRLGDPAGQRQEPRRVGFHAQA